ncbi:phosphopantetheine adenylyltransferase [Achromobacter sp. GG226]|uniref:phosphopantetheine adenylyltransferase n=1 Tax=Verticiella alkaliphila TaxID=2779529 RepID=UPI001C0B0B59|nr:phosphopantetheine adenylyltransferase [Verticiella sp. GG226]MBU4611776.1 phosphopantetheine adenylyltransferase [Verticiella sp. GG226]
MTETLTKLSWGALALIHAIPAAALFRPALLARLYGIGASGDLGVLMTHRAALFLAVAAVCVYAAFDPGARRAAGLVTGISVVGFLVLYASAGWPSGSLRGIAIGDAIALVPLIWVAWAAWRR